MMVYLNRFEGIPIDEFERARDALLKRNSAKTLEEITDAEFRRLVPSARDSVIILDPSIIMGMTQEGAPRNTVEGKCRFFGLSGWKNPSPTR